MSLYTVTQLLNWGIVILLYFLTNTSVLVLNNFICLHPWNMDKLLKPRVFETEASDTSAEKLYRHWKTTFQNYLETSIQPPVPGSDAAATAAAEAATERKKMFALFNNISADIYKLISECPNYNSAIQVLDATYIKPRSVV